MPHGRGISITRAVEALAPLPNRGDAFRIQISTSLAEMMPSEVFMMRRNTRDSATGTTVDEFCYIASPEDLVNYPTTDPAVGSSPPFFRVSSIDVLVGSRDIALLMWDAVQERICELVEALNRKDQLVVAETVRCGDVVEPPSQSMSESVSETVSV